MNYFTSVYWNAGNYRKLNQDSILVLQGLTRNGRVLLAAVCDGIGGAAQGEIASGYVTETLYIWFYDNLLPAVAREKPPWVIRRSLERKVYQMQSQMASYAKEQRIELGTTMSVLVLWEKRFFIWHLGDSRIYRLGRKSSWLTQMTKDHTAGEHGLTKCVGSFGFFLPDFRRGTLHRREAFLLCSDGFYRKQREQELWEVLQPEEKKLPREKSSLQGEKSGLQGEKRLRELGNAAIRRGEKDNLSAVYISIEK